MALPKGRQSKARSRKRRTHYKALQVTTSNWPQCSQPKCPIAHALTVVITKGAPSYQLLSKV